MSRPIRTIALCCVIAAIGHFSACRRSAGPTATTPPPPATTQFTPIRVLSLDNTKELKLISPDELEYTESGQTYLCKYTKQPDGLRAILGAGSLNQVLYFHYSKATDGIFDTHDGTTLYSQFDQAIRRDQAGMNGPQPQSGIPKRLESVHSSTPK